MEMTDLLKMCYLDLHCLLADQDVHLILGGGYGLFLKQQDLQYRNIETLLDVEIWPEARATNDLDLFLSAEVVTDASRMQLIRHTLDQLGYLEIPSAKYYQFFRPFGSGRTVKLDVMAGPLGDHALRVPKDERRVKPRPGVKLHARKVDEALVYDQSCMKIVVAGRLSSGQYHQAEVFIPQAFSYLLMKLAAFRDRKDDTDKNMGRHHALDVFRIMAMMTYEEYRRTVELFRIHHDHQQVKRAKQIIDDCFDREDAIGILRLREHPLFRRDIDIRTFLRDLHSLIAG